MKTDTHYESTLRDYLEVVFRHKAVIVTTVVILTLTAYGTLSMVTELYEAQVLMVKQAEKATEADYYMDLRTGSARLIEVEIAKSNPVIERTVNALKLYNRPLDYEKQFSSGFKTLLIDNRHEKLKRAIEKLSKEQKRARLFSIAVSQLRGSLRVEQQKDTNIFSITISDYSPTAAVIIANVVSRSYIIYDLERQLAEIRLKYGEEHSIIKQVNDKISEMQKYLDGRLVSDIEAIGPASVKILEQAKGAKRVKLYNKRLLLLVVCLLSIVLGIILSFLFEYMDQSIKTPRDIESFLKIHFLGSIVKTKSKDKQLTINPHLVSAYTKLYQKLTDHLDLLIKDKKHGSILITDVGSSDAALVTANIGIQLSIKEPDRNILIIDTNFKKSYISKVFNIENTPGLVDVLAGKINFEDSIKECAPKLSIVTAGEIEFEPYALLNSSRMFDVIRVAKEKYDVVLIVCADLNKFTDAVVLSSVIDAFILVLDEGVVRRQAVKFAMMPLEKQKANFIGAILNNRNFVIPKIIYDRL